MLAGSVSVDSTREERRAIEVTFDNTDKTFKHYPAGFWYDKVIKPFRGVELRDGSSYFWQMGEFMIDKISTPHFPHVAKVTGRDYTKKLVEDEFQITTAFDAGLAVEQVIQTIAVNGGINPTKMILPTTGKVLGKQFVFDAQTTRWKAINDIAVAYGYEVYFNGNGRMVMRTFQDPAHRFSTWVFQTGALTSNLVKYDKSAEGTRIRNAVQVTGESSDPNTPPVFAIAENHDPNSPTSIENLGRKRTLFYASPFITTTAQAQAVANRFLLVAALESYTLGVESIVFPFLEAAEVITFVDPDPSPGDPSRFLLTDFTIPLTLGSLSGNARRVTVIT